MTDILIDNFRESLYSRIINRFDDVDFEYEINSIKLKICARKWWIQGEKAKLQRIVDMIFPDDIVSTERSNAQDNIAKYLDEIDRFEVILEDVKRLQKLQKNSK